MPLYIDTRDDAGRRLAPPPRPITRTVFTARPKDRLTETAQPWKPEDIARALRQAEEGDLSAQSDMMEHMIEKDGELAGYAGTRTVAPSKVKWSIVPRNDTPEAKRVAERVKEIVESIPNMRGVLLKMADGILKGISALEIDWRDDKTISGIRWVHAKRYRFDWETETFMIVPDDPAKEWEPVPIARDQFKFVIHKPQLRAAHPAKCGVLRTVVWAFLFRNYSLKDWVAFSEIFGMPLRLAKYPVGMKDPDKDELRQAMEMLASDAYAIIDSRVTMEYVDAVNRGIHPGDAIYHAMALQYKIALLWQDQTNTHNEAGGRTQVEFGGSVVRQDLLEADCEDLSQTLQTDLLYPITGWHFDWGTADKYAPLFKLHYEPPEDYKELTTVDETVHLKLHLPTTWGEIAKRYGRELPQGIEPETLVFFNEYIPPGLESKPHVIITADGTGASRQQRDQWAKEEKKQFDQQQLPPDGEEEDGGGMRLIPGGKAEQRMLAAFTLLAQQQRATGSQETDPAQEELDARVAALVPRAAAAMQQLAGPVLSVIASSQSLEEIQQRLSLIYPDLDERGIERLLQRAWYISRLFGTATAAAQMRGASDADNQRS